MSDERPFRKSKLTVEGPEINLHKPFRADDEAGDYKIMIEIDAVPGEGLRVYELAAIITKYLRGDKVIA